MSYGLNIRHSAERKDKMLNGETYEAIKRACRVWADDAQVAAYAAAPHEGITPELMAHIRRRMIVRDELPARAFSRRADLAKA